MALFDPGKDIRILREPTVYLVGRQTIDLYVPSMGEVRNWGVKTVPIDIIEWGSKPMSLKLLRTRKVQLPRSYTPFRNEPRRVVRSRSPFYCDIQNHPQRTHDIVVYARAIRCCQLFRP